MDLESIIWIIIFLVYIASVFLKRIRRTAKTRKAAPITRMDSDQADTPDIIDSQARELPVEKKRSRWQSPLRRFQDQIQDKFGDFIKQIQQEMEAAKPKESKKETGWEKFLPPKDDAAKIVVATSARTDDLITTAPQDIQKDLTYKDTAPTRQKDVRRRMAQPLRTAPPSKSRTLAKKKVAEKKDPVDSKKERLEEDMTLSIRNLRKAVIWSEILAPPLALRDHQ